MSTKKRLDKRKDIKEKVYEYICTVQKEPKYLNKFIGHVFDGDLFTGYKEDEDVFEYIDINGNTIEGEMKDEMKIVKNIDEISIIHLMQYLKHLYYTKNKVNLVFNSHSVELVLLDELTGDSCVNVEYHSDTSRSSHVEHSFYTNCYKMLIDEQDEYAINKIFQIIEDLLY